RSAIPAWLPCLPMGQGIGAFVQPDDRRLTSDGADDPVAVGERGRGVAAEYREARGFHGRPHEGRSRRAEGLAVLASRHDPPVGSKGTDPTGGRARDPRRVTAAIDTKWPAMRTTPRPLRFTEGITRSRPPENAISLALAWEWHRQEDRPWTTAPSPAT